MVAKKIFKLKLRGGLDNISAAKLADKQLQIQENAAAVARSGLAVKARAANAKVVESVTNIAAQGVRSAESVVGMAEKGFGMAEKTLKGMETTLGIVGKLGHVPYNILSGTAYPLWANLSKYIALLLFIIFIIIVFQGKAGNLLNVSGWVGSIVNWIGQWIHMPHWLESFFQFFNVNNWFIVRIFSDLFNPLKAKNDPTRISRPIRKSGRCDNVEWVGGGADNDAVEKCISAVAPQDMALTPNYAGDENGVIPPEILKSSNGDNASSTNQINWAIQGDQFIPTCGPYTDDGNGSCVKPNFALTEYAKAYRKGGAAIDDYVSLPSA